MDWYYAQGGRQMGPVAEETFQGLVKEGKIRRDTLVWNATMGDWRAYGELGGPVPGPLSGSPGFSTGAGESFCSECGGAFSHENMIQYGNAWVCAACKPVFVQKLKEGVSVAGAMQYAGFWLRFAAKFIDWLIVGFVNMILGFAVGLMIAFTASSSDMFMGTILTLVLQLLQIAVAAAYNTWLIGKYGATLGKMACRIQAVTADGGRVSYARALGRYFAEMISAIILLIGYIMAAFDDEKRTLHDRICNTRVVFK